ncbi:MAG: hypothetical protein LUE13_06990 [Akkermansiaceae bacterium]|nr:hypothetical protein [Akkermansiaceae bacterium]
MLRLLLWCSLGLPGLPASVAQDVVASGEPDVDLAGLSDEERRKMILAISRMEILERIMQEIFFLETEETGAGAKLLGLVKFKLASVSGKVLEACPDDYRQAFQACTEAGRDLVRQFEGVEMEEPQFHREYSRYRGKCRAIMQPVKSRYRLKETLADPIIFLRRETDHFRKDKAKLLERFKALKKQVEQETFTFPEMTEQEREKFGTRVILY